MAKGKEIVRRAGSTALKHAKEAVVKMRSSAAAKRAKEVMVRRRSTGVAFVAGAAYEELQQRNIALPKIPGIPISAEAQEALGFALLADNTRGLVQEVAIAASHGLAWEAGRKLRRTGSIAGAGEDEDVIV